MIPSYSLKMQVRKARGSFVLTADVEIRGGGITVLRGPSGCGKTTIADMIAGRIDPDQGRIELAGRVLFDADAHIRLQPEDRGLGYVFQTHRLLPHLTVEENILFPLRCGNRRPRLSVGDLAALLGLERLLCRRTDGLSGGESQRVALARALAAAETMLVMDEPLASLDPERREALLAYIERIPTALPIPILYITHADDEARRLAGEVLEISAGRVRRLPHACSGGCSSQKETLL